MRNLRILATSASTTSAPSKTFFVLDANCVLPVDRIICSHARGSTTARQHHFAASTSPQMD